MPMQHTLFETALGTLVIAWSERGIRRVQQRERAFALPRGLELSVLGPRPPWVDDAIRRITLHVEGTPQDLSRLPLDMDSLPPFHRRIYELAREVEPGQTVTYGELASRAGHAAATRAVGQALAQNPFLLIVPCHRVVAAGGKLGGFSAEGGTDTKSRLLALERNTGVAFTANEGQLEFGFRPGAPAAHFTSNL